MKNKKEQVVENNTILQTEYEEIMQRISLLEKQQNDAQFKMNQLQHELNQCCEEKNEWQTKENIVYQQLEQLKNKLYQSDIKLKEVQLLNQKLIEHIAKDKEDLIHFINKKGITEERTEVLKDEILNQEHVLCEKLLNFQTLEQEKNKEAEKIVELKKQEDHYKVQIKQIESENKKTLRQIQQEELIFQELTIKINHILEILNELNVDKEEIIKKVDKDIPVNQYEMKLQEIVESLNQIGAINLLAIEEYDQEFLRKKQLDDQYQDLTIAIQSLESAIVAMDNETVIRLKETFSQVNGFFQDLFPRLFGGGSARLEWTCDNLLDAGVAIFAEPPGKRNKSIYLLSGGEKALTAIAFIFAMFQLNPSPFCLMDEVDAPLDDFNVERFCKLVKEMSDCVQFLFITHNKKTMELAQHLIGVTMREPGVSKIVAVDVEEALSMTE